MSGRPPAPTVSLLKNNSVDLEELGSANLDTYALYDDPLTGDYLYPSWWGCSAEGEAIDYSKDSDPPVNPVVYDPALAHPVFGMPMPINNDLVRRLDQGDVFYSYWLERDVRSKTKSGLIESSRIAFNVGRRDLLVAPQIKESHDEQLDPDTPSTQLTIVAPPYLAMARGDRVTLRWEGVRENGTSPDPVTVALNITDALVGKVLSWKVAKQHVTAIRNGKVKLSYTIVYASPSLKPNATSAARQISIILPTTTRLEKVSIKDFTGDELDPGAYPQGIKLLIQPWPGIRVGDNLVLYWTGNRDNRTVVKSQQVDLSSLDTGKIEVALEYAWLTANNKQPVTVSYQYFRSDASGASEPLQLTVQGREDLGKPSIEGAYLGDGTLDGKLDTQQFANTGVFVNIPANVTISDEEMAIIEWVGFGEAVEVVVPVTGQPKRFNVPAYAIPANMDRAVEIYYRIKRKDAPVGTPGTPSERYLLGVDKIPQNKLGTMNCEKSVNGELKRSSVPATGVAVTFRPLTWIYIAETQLIRMWLTASNDEATIIQERNVSSGEVTAGVRGLLRPEHLSSIADGASFSIRFSVSFDGGETQTLFQPLSLKLLA
jgi:hypothetical protein